MVGVGDDVGDPHELPLERAREVVPLREDRPPPLGVLEDPLPHLAGEIEPRALPLELLDHPHALARVVEAAWHEARQHELAGVAKGRVTEVMAHGHRLGEILVQAERARHRARHLGHLEGVGDAGPVVIPLGRQEDLGLVGKTAKRLGVEDAITVALERRAEIILRLRPCTALGFRRQTGLLRQDLALPRLEVLANGTHWHEHNRILLW